LNILFDAWLPVEAADGSLSIVAPVDIPGSAAVRVAHARADYSALATELLIDIFQTVCAPRSNDERIEYTECGKLPVLAQFENLRAAFEVAGDGARFMQAAKADPEAAASVSALFFEAPGGNTLKLNKDVFVSRDAASSLCLRCAPVALYLVQSHARMGGQGYLVGPRATSAMAAIVEAPTLWETICLNLISTEWFDAQTGVEHPEELSSFPWMNPKVRLDEKRELPISAFGRFGVLWWTPLNVRLDVSANTHGEVCAACGQVHDEHVSTVTWKATKAKLVAGVQHPRTGWNPKGNGGEGRAIEIPDEGWTFQNWLALTVGADVKYSLRAWQQLNWRQVDRVSLRVFGFSMNMNSPVAWVDVSAPVFVPASEEARIALTESATTLVGAAVSAVQALRESLYWNNKKSLDNPPVPRVVSPLEAGQLVWDELTPEIIRVLRTLAGNFLTVPDADAFKAKARNAALKTFDRVTVDHGENPKISRGLMARRANLFKKLSPKK
jgi:CRISPR system Cascade subunit CasA